MQQLRFVTTSLETGGTEIHMLRILPNLIKQGIKVRILVIGTQSKNTPTNDFLQTGAQVHFLAKKGGAIGALVSLRQDLRQRPNEITHFWTPKAYLLGMLCAILCRYKSPLIMSRRALNYYQQKHPGSAWLEKKLHPKTTRILANSQAICDQLHQQEQVPHSHTRLIYNGVAQPTTNNPDLLRQQHQIGPDTLVLIKIANLFPYKGHIDLLQALANITLPTPWVLLCAGSDRNNQLAKLQAISQQHGINENIRWLQHETQAWQLLPMADIALLCSHQEGFANSIIEAMSYAKPVIATDVGGNAEAIRHQKTGLIVPAHQPDQLGKAIQTLAADTNKQKNMGDAGYQRWKTHFSLEKCCQEYQAMYQEIQEQEPCAV
jgi:glycosyltransferase involved in cell wall biosynthesis